VVEVLEQARRTTVRDSRLGAGNCRLSAPTAVGNRLSAKVLRFCRVTKRVRLRHSRRLLYPPIPSVRSLGAVLRLVVARISQNAMCQDRLYAVAPASRFTFIKKTWIEEPHKNAPI